MTTSPVMSITEELVAELEALASECGQHGTNWYEPRHMEAFPEYACDQDFVVAASPATILALLAERAELNRDAGRLEWMMSESCVLECMNGTVSPVVYRLYWHGEDVAQSEWYPSKRAAIDAAMQSDNKE